MPNSVSSHHYKVRSSTDDKSGRHTSRSGCSSYLLEAYMGVVRLILQHITRRVSQQANHDADLKWEPVPALKKCNM